MNAALLCDDQQGIHDLWGALHARIEAAYQGQCGLDSAYSFEQAETMVALKEYGVVILDLVMPSGDVKDGIRFISKHAKDWPPIIAFTGHNDIWIRRACLVAGAVDFWIKEDLRNNPD